MILKLFIFAALILNLNAGGGKPDETHESEKKNRILDRDILDVLKGDNIGNCFKLFKNTFSEEDLDEIDEEWKKLIEDTKLDKEQETQLEKTIDNCYKTLNKIRRENQISYYITTYQDQNCTRANGYTKIAPRDYILSKEEHGNLSYYKEYENEILFGSSSWKCHADGETLINENEKKIKQNKCVANDGRYSRSISWIGACSKPKEIILKDHGNPYIKKQKFLLPKFNDLEQEYWHCSPQGDTLIRHMHGFRENVLRTYYNRFNEEQRDTIQSYGKRFSWTGACTRKVEANIAK